MTLYLYLYDGSMTEFSASSYFSRNQAKPWTSQFCDNPIFCNGLHAINLRTSSVL